MAKSDRVENPVVREYLYQFVPEQVNANSLFVKMYGNSFATTKIKENVLIVYSNEPYSVNGAAAYQNAREKSITFCCPRDKQENLLTPEEIAKDKNLQEAAIHESIHALLQRTEKECKLYNIYGGTGLLEKYYINRAYSEIGRGLNEGFTEWLCEKLGYKPPAYKELTNFVRLIEIAIGTEKTMALGKGGVHVNFSELLNLTNDEIDYLLAMADQVYNVNEHIITMTNLTKILQDHISIDKLGGDRKERAQKEYEDSLEKIEEYMHDPVFLNYAKTHQKEVTEATLVEYLREVRIKDCTKQRIASVASFESFMLEKYFEKDLQQVFSSETISDENFEKLIKINSILNSKLNEIPEDLRQMDPKPKIVWFKEEFKNVTERYVKQLAIREAKKYQAGQLEMKQLIQKDKRLLDSSAKLSDIFFKELAKQIAPGMEPLLLSVLNSAHKYSDNAKYLRGIANASLYQLQSKDPNLKLTSILVFDKENFFDKFNSRGSSVNSVDEEIEFEFTADMSTGEDEYPIAMQNFLKLQQEVFARNPNARIHIASREVIVQEGEKLKFYTIHQGQLIPMIVEKSQELKFVYREPTQEKAETTLTPVKVGFWATVVNRFRRALNDWKNKGKEDIPNYVDDENTGRIIFDIPGENKIDSYQVNNFEHMLEQKQSQQIQNESEQIYMQENDQEKE